MSSSSSSTITTENEINDIRGPKEFRNISFSKFNKTDVKKELLQGFIHSKIEQCCYWSAELICAGHFSELWEIIILFYTKHIHMGNPKLAVYLDMRMGQFRDIVNNVDGIGTINELDLRNNLKIRRLFCEIICVLCDAKIKHSFQEVKIKKEDFDVTYMTDRFKAPNVYFVADIFLEEDPKEIFVALNEFAYNLSMKNTVPACYWMEWIIEYDSICRCKRELIICQRRDSSPVEEKFKTDVIWIIWETFHHYADSVAQNTLLKNIIKALFNLFCVRYSHASSKKKKYILYFVISLLTEPVDVKNEEIIRSSQKEVLSQIKEKIHLIYGQIKKNEEFPGEDYKLNLNKDVKTRNLEKTIEKLEQLNSFGNTFLPRIQD
jgi:hypothetical protein